MWTPTLMRKTEIWQTRHRYWGCAIYSVCVCVCVRASCHLWSRTSRGWGDQVTVLNNPRCDSGVVLAVGCKKYRRLGHTPPCLSKSILLTDPSLSGIDTLLDLTNKICSKWPLESRKVVKKRTWTCTWTMSLSAYLPLEEILISSPSSSIIAEEDRHEIKLFTAETMLRP